MTTSTHCPGFESFKNLKSFICKCTHCGAEKEVFSDEFDRKHACAKCHQQMDFGECQFHAGSDDRTP